MRDSRRRETKSRDYILPVEVSVGLFLKRHIGALKSSTRACAYSIMTKRDCARKEAAMRCGKTGLKIKKRLPERPWHHINDVKEDLTNLIDFSKLGAVGES